MRVKKLLKVTAITVVSLGVFLSAAVSVLVFNPFEGALTDMRDVVPRDIDFFARKLDLRSDIVEGEFPEPLFWSDFSNHPEWRDRVVPGPAYQELNGRGELNAVFGDIRDQVVEIRQQSRGYLDVLDDVIGTEVQIAGKISGPAQGGTKWCVYARVSWSAKFAWGMLSYGFVQEQIRQSGVVVRIDGDLIVIEPTNGAPLYGARYLDCLVLGNDRDLVQRSFALASGVGDPDSFGGSASYRDGIERRIEEWEEQTDEVANAVEFYLRPDQLFALPDVTWDDNWPDANHPDDMNSRVLASFLNLDSWLHLTGAMLFEEDSFSLLADIELNQNKHTAFQGEFFRTEKQHRKEWLDPFLNMVPISSCALAAMRMPAGEFLREMYSALTETEKELFNDALRGTGQWKDVPDLIAMLEPALHPRTGFVFRMNTPDKQIPVADPDPSVPQIAWVFWIRKGGRKVVADFVKTVTKYQEVLQFSNAYDLSLSLGGGIGGDAAREFTNPQIPGTGSVATLIYDQFFVLSNSGPFIRDMMQAYLGRRPSVRQREDFDEYARELPETVNGLVYLQGAELQKLLEKSLQAIDSSNTDPDPAWALERRGTAETTVFRRKYSARYRSLAAIPAEAKAEFDTDVDNELGAMWAREASGYSAADRRAVLQVLGLSGLFRSSYIQVILEPRHLRLAGRAIVRR